MQRCLKKCQKSNISEFQFLHLTFISKCRYLSTKQLWHDAPTTVTFLWHVRTILEKNQPQFSKKIKFACKFAEFACKLVKNGKVNFWLICMQIWKIFQNPNFKRSILRKKMVYRGGRHRRKLSLYISSESSVVLRCLRTFAKNDNMLQICYL